MELIVIASQRQPDRNANRGTAWRALLLFEVVLPAAVLWGLENVAD